MMLEWRKCEQCGADDMPFKRGILICLNPDCPSNDDELSLWGKNVVISGTFRTGDQYYIKQLLRKEGAIIKESVSSKVDILIRGNYSNGYTWSAQSGSYKTNKEVAAEKLGKLIITEDEFLKAIGQRP